MLHFGAQLTLLGTTTGALFVLWPSALDTFLYVWPVARSAIYCEFALNYLFLEVIEAGGLAAAQVLPLSTATAPVCDCMGHYAQSCK